jgi:hypothetical protein
VYIFLFRNMLFFAESADPMYDCNAFCSFDIFCKISGPTYMDGYSCLFKPLVVPPHV